MSCTKLCLASAALLALGCTFEDGQPWGVAEVSLEARFAPSEGRLEDGRLKTSHGLTIELDEVGAAFGVVVLTGAAGAATAFDPADPPPGYSLCHNGHCHHESGALVEYEDIAIEQAGGSEWVLDVAADLTDLGAEPRRLALGACPDGCQLPRGRVVAAGTRMTRLRVVGTAFGEGLPEEGLAFEHDLALNADVRTQLDAAVDRDAPIGLRVELLFDVPAQLFDRVDPAAEDAADRLRENLAEHAEITASVARFDP